MIRVLSLGGGTQSCALALMSAAGDLPRLDAVVFADTHGELPETYAYLEYLAARLADADIPYHVVSPGSLEAALLSADRTTCNPTPPAHVLNPDGTKGRIGQYRCSYDYKRRIIEQKVKQLVGGRGAWKHPNVVEQWIGFSEDELGRCKPALGCICGHPSRRHVVADEELGNRCASCKCAGEFQPWQVNRWPLIELGYRRDDTIRWFADNGHPTPPRSACWFCPNSGNERWQELRATHPDKFERACIIDDTIRNGSGFNARGNQPFVGQMFLHKSLIPLRDADLRTARQITRDAGQGELFDSDALAMDCSAGVCFT